MHEQLRPGPRQPDTCPASLKHHLSLNYSLSQWASLLPVRSLIRELMSHRSCWPRIKERNAKCPLPPPPLLTLEEMKSCSLLVARLAKKMDGQEAACGERKWACRFVCMHVNVCFEAKRSVRAMCVRCPQVWLVWPVILKGAHLVPIFVVHVLFKFW